MKGSRFVLGLFALLIVLGVWLYGITRAAIEERRRGAETPLPAATAPAATPPAEPGGT